MRVAETLNVSEAARQLYLAQPAISRYIKDLEEATGVLLFDRTGRHIALTEAGLFLLHSAKRVIEAGEQWERAVESIRRGTTGELNLAATASWESILPRAIGQLAKEHPTVAFRLTFVDYRQVMDLVLRNEVHLGFMPLAPEGADFERIPMGTDQMLLVAAPEHPLVRSQPTRPNTGGPLPLVLALDYKLIPEHARRYVTSFGFEVTTTVQLQSAELVKRAILSGVGVGLQLKSRIATELARGELVPLFPEVPPCPVTLCAIRHRRRAVGPIQEAFLTEVVEVLRRCGIPAGDPREPNVAGGNP